MINDMITVGRAEIEKLFKQHNIDAPVTEKTVKQAILVVPNFSTQLASKFEVSKFDSSGDSDNEEDDNEDMNNVFDSVNGIKKKKKVKKEKTTTTSRPKVKLKDALDTAGKIAASAKQLKDATKTPVETKEEETKKPAKKILGISPMIFYSILLIVILVIIFFIVKSKK